MEAITSRMAALEARVAAQNEMYAIIATLFDYNDDNASVTTVPAFKQELIRACSAEIQTAFQGEPLVFCTLTGLYLPKQARQARWAARDWVGRFADELPRAGGNGGAHLEARVACVRAHAHGLRDR